jgi:putative phosphoribosyl transferase
MVRPMNMRFDDRDDAGQRLASAVLAAATAEGWPSPVVLGLPRGGVPVAAHVAAALQAPLEVMLVRKIGVPWQPELAVAAVADAGQPVLVVDEETLRYSGTSREHVQRALPEHWQEIERRRRLYLQGRPLLPLAGRTAILVDDGMATGTTVRAALKALATRGAAKTVVALPVAPASEAAKLRQDVDALVCLSTPSLFGSVGEHYRNFWQTSDDEVVHLLEQAARRQQA